MCPGRDLDRIPEGLRGPECSSTDKNWPDVEKVTTESPARELSYFLHPHTCSGICALSLDERWGYDPDAAAGACIGIAGHSR